MVEGFFFLALFGGMFFVFVCFGGCFFSLGEAEGERLVLWSLGCFFFLNVLREVGLSCGACWIEIEVIVRQAGLVICNSSNDRSEFVAKLPRNISDFNSLVPLLELKIRCRGE